MNRAASSDRLADKLASLRDHTREELAARWMAIYGFAPPPGVRRELLCHAVAWRLQAKHLGGLSLETRRQLKQAVECVVKRRERAVRSLTGDGPIRAAVPSDVAQADGGADDAGKDGEFLASSGAAETEPGLRSKRTGASPSRRAPVERRNLGRGARLLRDWNCRTHVVDVVDGGFLYDGKIYRSLSAVARLITGVRWSGPRFFGL